MRDSYLKRRLPIILIISILFLLGFNVKVYADGIATVTATVSISICGNREIEGGEVCDTGNLGGMSCKDFGYDRGDLRCSVSCQEYDLDDCYSSTDILEEVEVLEEIGADSISEDTVELSNERDDSELVIDFDKTKFIDVHIEIDTFFNSVENYNVSTEGSNSNIIRALPP